MLISTLLVQGTLDLALDGPAWRGTGNDSIQHDEVSPSMLCYDQSESNMCNCVC